MTPPTTALGKRILLVDDQQEVRETISMLLSMDEHTVTEAANGREAFSLFAPDRFDLVITDYAMPVMRGDELATNIKQAAPAQPILMITGSADQTSGAASSVDGFLRKPFGVDELTHALEKALGTRTRPGPAGSDAKTASPGA